MVAVSVSSVYAGARVCFTTDSSQCVRVYPAVGAGEGIR